MDEKEKQIEVRFDNAYLKSVFFQHLSKDNAGEIEHRMACGDSFAAGFFQNGDLKFCAIFDLNATSLHVREVAGYFGKIHDVLDCVSQGLAMFFNKKYITFKTEKRAVAKWAEKQNYIINPDNEFQKVLH